MNLRKIIKSVELKSLPINDRRITELEDGVPDVVDLKDDANWKEVDDDICIGESLSMEDAVARRRKEAEANGDVIQIDD